MSKELTRVKEFQFHALTCEIYSDGKDYCMTREQIGRALEYRDPVDAIRKIHERHKERLNQFSVVDKLSGTDGKMYDTFLYNARGIYEICRWSHQPKADEFYDHVYDLLEGLRQGQLRIQINHQSPHWQSARLEVKKARRMETDAVKAFVQYAAAQGSMSADKYYIHFSNMADKAAGIADRDTASTEQLLNLRMIEKIIERAVLSEISAGTEYHQAYQNVNGKVQQFAVLAFGPVLALAS